MPKSKEFLDIKNQSKFCVELMQRLNNDIQKAGESSWYGGMENHTRIQNDIKRIRRELHDLFDLLDPWRG